MRFASSITAARDVSTALAELLPPLEARITPGAVDFVTLFLSGHYREQAEVLLERVQAFFPTAAIIGCTAEGTMGCGRELERVHSLSVFAAELPDVGVHPFHITQDMLERADDVPDWERMVAVSPESTPVFIAFADPFRFNVHGFIDGINAFYPAAPLVGGVASGGSAPRQNRLLALGEVFTDGVVGAALSGPIRVETVVSQGCRPIGRPFVITRGERNVIRELGGRVALEQLHEVLVKLPQEDEQLAKQSLLIGRVIDEYKDRFARGDFLIHNILGVDRNTGAIGIAGQAKTGSTVQFHVRDSSSADEDLRMMLTPHAVGVAGALVFGCNGRGTHMWAEPGHDMGVLRELCGDVPVGGFFCGGEFGPVGGRNFIHGFTACIALFHDNEPAPADPK